MERVRSLVNGCMDRIGEAAREKDVCLARWKLPGSLGVCRLLVIKQVMGYMRKVCGLRGRSILFPAAERCSSATPCHHVHMSFQKPCAGSQEYKVDDS